MYFFIDKPLSEIAVFVWKIVHIPPKDVKAVISAIIKEVGVVIALSAQDKNKPNPLVISSVEPKMAACISDIYKV